LFIPPQAAWSPGGTVGNRATSSKSTALTQWRRAFARSVPARDGAPRVASKDLNFGPSIVEANANELAHFDYQSYPIEQVNDVHNETETPDREHEIYNYFN
jgi:hypothetical protein